MPVTDGALDRSPTKEGGAVGEMVGAHASGTRMHNSGTSDVGSADEVGASDGGIEGIVEGLIVDVGRGEVDG